MWDMSSENEYLASVGDRTNIAELATATAFTIDRMCQDFDKVIIKELPPCVQSVFCQELGRYNLKKVGMFDNNEIVVWRPMPGEA